MTDTTQTSITNEQIIITEKAANRVNVILEGEGKVGYGLRVSVVGGGCSGMTYNMSFDNKQGEFESGGNGRNKL